MIRSPSTVVQPPASSQSAQVAKSSNVLTPSSAKHFDHLRRQAFEGKQAVFGTQLAGTGFGLLVLLVEIIAGTGLKLASRVLVDAVDHQKLVNLDIGDLFKVGEPFRNQKLGKELVQVQRVHEQLRALLRTRPDGAGFPLPRS